MVLLWTHYLNNIELSINAKQEVEIDSISCFDIYCFSESYIFLIRTKHLQSSTNILRVAETSILKLLSCFYFFGQRPQQYVSFLRFLWLKVTDKVADRSAVHKVVWVHTYCSLFHQSVLPVLSIHGERLPYHKAGTHYAYDKTGNLADATEIENDHKNEDSQQTSCKEEEVLRLQALELPRPAYTLIDFKCCHRLTGRNFSG